LKELLEEKEDVIEELNPKNTERADKILKQLADGIDMTFK